MNLKFYSMPTELEKGVIVLFVGVRTSVCFTKTVYMYLAYWLILRIE
jgi:hypothetical protein